jgi:ferredoxin, 2Fe-2S
MLRQFPFLLHKSTYALSQSRRRWIQNSSIDPSVADRLSQLGVDSALHKEVIQALASVLGGTISVSTLEQFGPEGIQALAKSIENVRPKTEGTRASRKVTISIPHHRTEFQVKFRQGQSLMQLAQDHDVLAEYIEGSCGGTMACCSCHVYLDPASYAALGGAPSQEELDMLDLAHEQRDTSRLACQVYLNDELLRVENMVVTIPDGVNNVW